MAGYRTSVVPKGDMTMSRTKKRLFIAVVVVLLLLLAMPVSNLIVGLPQNNAIASIVTNNDTFAEARDVMAQKCVNCHAEDYVLPKYAFLPIVKGIIERDIHVGTEYMDLAKSLRTEPGTPVSEVVVAKIEQTLNDGSMPPKPYLALHWNGALTEPERDGIMNWIRSVRTANYATGTAAPAFASDMLQPVPDSVDEDPAKVALGDKLFHDTRLSGDNSVSCASCHSLDKGGTDQRQYALGVGDTEGGINSPTVYNSGLHFAQFWDGRAANLEEQADGPVNNPAEMASNWQEVCTKLNQDPEFIEQFNAVYPEGPSKESMIDAIATFERTLVTPNSKFDRYLKGETDTLNAEELKGHQLFMEFGCATCHVGKAMGGQSYEKMGRTKDFFTGRKLTDADNGRYNVTKDEADRHKFKTPTLRNIAVTEPYFHDGSTSDLEEVVRVMAEYQIGKTMTDDQVTAVTAFLNTLTGEYKGKILQ